MKRAVVLFVLTAILTGLMAPAVYASASLDKAPKHFNLSEPVETFLASEGLEVVAMDENGNYILVNNEFGYQALMTRDFAESLATQSGDATEFGVVSPMADPDNQARLWSYIVSAYTVFCMVRDIYTFAEYVEDGYGDECIPTTMEWIKCCDIINGVVYWN